MNKRKDFSRNARENIPPVARGSTRNERGKSSMDLNLGGGDKREMRGGGSDCCEGESFGERSALIGSARLSPSSVVLPTKS